MLTRARRVVEACEDLLGGPVLHYHSKNLVKYPEEGGVWNWHQDVRSVIAVVSSATLTSLTRVTAPLIFCLPHCSLASTTLATWMQPWCSMATGTRTSS